MYYKIKNRVFQIFKANAKAYTKVIQLNVDVIGK